LFAFLMVGNFSSKYFSVNVDVLAPKKCSHFSLMVVIPTRKSAEGLVNVSGKRLDRVVASSKRM